MVAHPLTAPATWQLSMGAGHAKVLRHAGIALWLLSTAVLLVWAFALLNEAVVWGLDAVYVVSACTLTMLWLAAAWQIWRRWHVAATPLTLAWTGLPQVPASSKHGRYPAADGISEGFRILQWRAPVHVQVMLDLPAWMLLRLRPMPSVVTGQQVDSAWVWLDMRSRSAAASTTMHQLRTLLRLPPRMIMLADMTVCYRGQHDEAVAPVASWAIKFKSGPKLRRPVTLRNAVRRSAQAASQADSHFPPTQVLIDGWTSRDTAACDHEVRS